ncbi:MAG: hypothetical protein Q6370_026195 [Candidatus Sigynarchaeota archaeon]
MGKKQPPSEAPVHEGGPHEELFGILAKEAELQHEIDELAGRKILLVEMLCAEANMTEVTRKSLRFGVKGKDKIVVIKRIDRLQVTDDTARDQLDAAKAEHDARIKPAEDLYLAKKRLIEQEALAAGRATKVASFYASFEGEPSRSRFEREEE